MIGDEVEQDPDPAGVGLHDQLVEVGERAEIGMNVAVVRHVVPPVSVRRRHRRVQPDPVDAEPLEVVEPRRQAGQVADAVAVRVREGTRIDLIEDALAPPLCARHRRIVPMA